MREKRRPVLLGLVLALLLLAGCGAGETDPAQPMAYEDLPQDGPFTIFDCDGVEVALYTALLDQVEVEVLPPNRKDVLLQVWEKASLEAAARDGVTDPKQVCGQVLQVRRYTRQQFRKALEQETVPYQHFRTQDAVGRFYALECRNPEQLYRSGPITAEDQETWDRVSCIGAFACKDFRWRNTTHQPVTMEDLGQEFPELPEVGTFLRSVRGEDLTMDPPAGWPPERLEELTAVLNRAGGKPLFNRADRAYGPYLGKVDVWKLTLRGPEDCSLSLSCSPEEEPLVAVSLWNDRQWEALCIEDQELFDLVRHGRDGPQRIDPDAYRSHHALLEQTRQAVLLAQCDNPGLLTECKLLQLTHTFDHREADGSLIAIYDVGFAMQAERPEEVDWCGSLYRDGDFNIRGGNTFGQMGVRYRDSQQVAAAFLGRENYVAPWLDNSEKWDTITWVLNQAELGSINPMRVYCEEDVDAAVLASSLYFEDSESQDALSVVLWPRHEVDDFTYFQVNFTDQGDWVQLQEGQQLYHQEALSFNRPLRITLERPGDIPSRGVGFRVGDNYHLYAIARGGEDSGIYLEPIN